jgi:hypothetical protein
MIDEEDDDDDDNVSKNKNSGVLVRNTPITS